MFAADLKVYLLLTVKFQTIDKIRDVRYAGQYIHLKSSLNSVKDPICKMPADKFEKEEE